jgi:hypothetical protein
MEGNLQAFSLAYCTTLGVVAFLNIETSEKLAGAGNFSLRHRVQTSSAAHLTSYLMDNGALSSGLQRPGCAADHSPTSSTEINAWCYTSTSPYVFMA